MCCRTTRPGTRPCSKANTRRRSWMTSRPWHARKGCGTCSCPACAMTNPAPGWTTSTTHRSPRPWANCTGRLRCSTAAHPTPATWSCCTASPRRRSARSGSHRCSMERSDPPSPCPSRRGLVRPDQPADHGAARRRCTGAQRPQVFITGVAHPACKLLIVMARNAATTAVRRTSSTTSTACCWCR
ncbi:hypothetical protein Y695_04242 [Hydrogenophaga sp. T4]|nr:hypothetical protein Y695_04242 [Hydrogenophaga sp. T4]